MAQNIRKTQEQVNIIINQFIATIKHKFTKFSKVLLQKTQPNQINQKFQVFSQTLAQFSFNVVQLYLEYFPQIQSVLQSLKGKEEMDRNQCKTHQSLIQQFIDQSALYKLQVSPRQKVICVKKQNYGILINEERDARKKFFTKQIKNKLNSRLIAENEQEQIIKLFLEKQNQISQDQLGTLIKYRDQIQQLKHSLQLIKQRYQINKIECLIIHQIISKNIDTLKIIRIQYQQATNNGSHNGQYLYSISAFELFHVVHKNKQLAQLTLKGVQVQQFQHFIRILNLTKMHQQYQDDIISWINSFCPLKMLKVSIDVELKFYLCHKEETFQRIYDLVLFKDFFSELSDITIWVKLEEQPEVGQWGNQMQELWKCLQGIRKLKVEIIGNFMQITAETARQLMFLICGGLASLTEITQLSFLQLNFRKEIGIEVILEIEQSLAILFQKDTITHLRLESCRNFPAFPSITTLQLIHLHNFTFRNQFSSMIAQTQASLKSLTCSQTTYQCIIDQQLFNQLQNLIIRKCNRISFKDFSSKSPSNIKFLCIQGSRVERVPLSMIFAKLQKLTYLQLNEIDFGHELLCTIPSPNLGELHIYNNHTITDADLKVIDQKWPYLSKISLKYCFKLTVNVWNICEFKGLVKMWVQERMLGEGKTCLQLLKSKGIKVN